MTSYSTTSAGRAVEGGDLDAVAAQLDDLVLAELDRVAGVRDERGDVGGEEVLALAAADDERAVAPRADDDVGDVGVHGDEREGAGEPAADHAHALGEVHAHGRQHLGEQVGDDLGVGLGVERDAALGELGAQLGEVLDDPVVDDGDLAVLADVRVRVGVGGAAVGGPARVADADGRLRQRVGAEQRLEVGELARLLARVEAPLGHHGDARGVVAAVLEAPQPVDHDRQRLLLADVPHDSAHAPRGYPGSAATPRCPRARVRRPISRAWPRTTSARRSATVGGLLVRLGLDHDAHDGLGARGRSSTRPVSPSSASTSATAAASVGLGVDPGAVDAAHVEQHLRAACCTTPARSASVRPVCGDARQQVQRGEHAVARGGVVGQDHVPALLAAEDVAALAHRLEHVAVAHAGLDHGEAGARAARA